MPQDERPGSGVPAEAREELDGYAARFGKPLFSSLWVKAWGDQYPVEVQPFSSCTRELLEQLIEDIDLRSDGVLADLGCGAGGVGLWVGRRVGCQIVGVDRSGPGVAIATRRAMEWQMSERADFVVGDFSATGLAAGSVDAAISVDALPFASDVDAALREVRRILRPRGRLVFTTREMRLNAEKAEQLGPDWSKALARNGFSTIRVRQRPGISALWRAVYDQWLTHETALREELTDAIVERLLAEVRDVGPKLPEDRAWLLIAAVAEA
jgi:ubiquinone/menaquinone biosynthesis C-methylase UbiE